jgi:hypothetical protein
MNARLLPNLTTAVILVAGLVAGPVAMAAVGKVLSAPFKDTENRHSALEKVIEQKANFETLKTKEGTEAFELNKAITKVAELRKESANAVSSFALKGVREAKIVRNLAKASEVIVKKEKEAGLNEADKAELSQLKGTVDAASGLVATLGRAKTWGKTGSKELDGLDRLVTILPTILAEYSKDDRQGYLKLMNDITTEMNRPDNLDLPADILKKKLGEERLGQLLGCKA